MPYNKTTILMAAAEVAPFAKAGGLADVLGSLPTAIKKRKYDVRIIMPLYGSIDKEKHHLMKIHSGLMIPSGRVLIKTDIWKTYIPNSKVPVYFIDAPAYFKYDKIYINGNNSERFLFFSMAVLYALPVIDFIPTIMHCHDFHTALIPDLIKASTEPYLKNIKTIYTIHNFNYQGKTHPHVLSTANLHQKSLKSLAIDARDGDINFMVQGILNSDLVTTVSPTYAKEITESAYGAGLERIIKKRSEDLYGIVNGIDVETFNPKHDPYIKENYSYKTAEKDKKKNKLALQKELGLKKDASIPLISVVSRLVWQKGLDLITDEIAKLDAQFVVLGTGEKIYENQFKKLAKKFPEKISANIFFDEALAQKIYAGSDLFLMPSRFEPCGLGQMIAMRYGSVPVVRETGGLIDTVNGLKQTIGKTALIFPNLDKSDGFTFKLVDSNELFNQIKMAIDIYHNNPKIWKFLVQNGMKKDFSWDKSALEYIKLYQRMARK